MTPYGGIDLSQHCSGNHLSKIHVTFPGTNELNHPNSPPIFVWLLCLCQIYNMQLLDCLFQCFIHKKLMWSYCFYALCQCSCNFNNVLYILQTISLEYTLNSVCHIFLLFIALNIYTIDCLYHSLFKPFISLTVYTLTVYTIDRLYYLCHWLFLPLIIFVGSSNSHDHNVVRKSEDCMYVNWTWQHNILSTSNGYWCMGIKGEMSGTVCVTFT